MVEYRQSFPCMHVCNLRRNIIFTFAKHGNLKLMFYTTLRNYVYPGVDPEGVL